MKKPKADTIIAFLKSKGWRVTEKNDKTCTLSPPRDLKFRSPFTYRIPTREDAVDYVEYAIRQVFSIAELYSLNRWDLLDLLSLSLEEIQQDVRLKQAMLSHA